MTLRQELHEQLQKAEGRLGCVKSVLQDLANKEGLDLSGYIDHFEDLARQVTISAKRLEEYLPKEAI